MAQEIRKLNLESVLYTEPKRIYPHGRLASQLLGFVGTDEGLAGLEYQYEEELKARMEELNCKPMPGQAAATGREVFSP